MRTIAKAHKIRDILRPKSKGPWFWYRRNTSTVVEAKVLERFSLLITKSGIFIGYKGDYQLRSGNHTWFCERDAFERLYMEV